MNRKQLIKVATGLIECGALSPEGDDGVPGERRRRKSLCARSLQALAMLTEYILPATDWPGAIAADVPHHVDQIFTRWMSRHERRAFLCGLEQLDACARARHGCTLADCSAAQCSDVYAQALDTAISDMQLRASQAERSVGYEAPFALWLRDLTVAAYRGSQLGARAIPWRVPSMPFVMRTPPALSQHEYC